MISTNLFERLKYALAYNDYSKLDDDFTSDAVIENSLTGSGKGYDDFVRLFKYDGVGSNCVKTNFKNVICRENKSEAAYSFHLLRQYSDFGSNDFMNFLQYGATVVVKMRLEGSNFKINQIIFELAWIDGNTIWLEGQSLIDYTVPRVTPKLIQAKEDGVVNIIELEKDDRSDEDKIREVLFVYGWFVDYEDYDAFEKVANKDLKIIDGFHNQVLKGRDSWINFVKSLHLKESFLHHTYHITSFDIDGNKATVKMSRVEPNRIGSKVINKTNYRNDWFTMDLIMNLSKKETGEWILDQAELIKNIRPVDSNGILVKK